MSKKVWMYSPKKVKPQLPENKKAEIFAECRKFIDSDLSPCLAKKFNENQKQFHLAEIRCKWNGNFLYFIACYKNVKIKMTHSECEEKFARLEYQENNKFSVAYFRHTGQWHNLSYGNGVSLKKCFKMIKGWPHLQPIRFQY